ncbi:hypothetical protein KPL37_01825 [Clostridium frigoris]|uniref:Uncharacterized protein n=1 Tax=Clostridium frigoris TaxID=205327 RepID=A0ABS6BNK8_9CLOT|nr:hypothetical protein [Clostridium frigoris]MBU3158509.1 hypothetical protein [Clostridium frigoris]
MKHHIKVVTNTKLEEITEKGIKTINSKFQWKEYEADTVVLALGMRARKDKIEELRHLIPETEVYIIGDGHQIGNVYSAVHVGFDTAVEI